MESVDDVLDEPRRPGLSFGLVLAHGASHALGDHPDLALLPLFPHPVGHVEEDPLEEEHERHPLIVRVIPLLADVAAEARMRHMGPDSLVLVLRESERVRYPAESVYHVARHRSVRYAIYRITCEYFFPKRYLTHQIRKSKSNKCFCNKINKDQKSKRKKTEQIHVEIKKNEIEENVKTRIKKIFEIQKRGSKQFGIQK